MGKIIVPSHIEQIFDKPERTKDEHKRVQLWLLEEHINQRLFLYATRHLGTSATQADAEMVLDKFIFGRGLSDFIKSYDPSKPNGKSFWNYLLFCFERFCWKEEERLQKSRKLAPSSRSVLTTKTEEGIEWEVTVSEPDGILEEIANNAVMAALQECVNNLTPARKEAVILFYFEELRGKEVAKRLSIREAAIRTRLKNGRRDLKNCLQEKGYPSWKFVEYERQQNS